MSEPDVPLAAEFEPPTREAWLTLVEKALKGGDFEKRLVSRTADGLAIQPLYTRADAVQGRPPPDARLVPGRLGRAPAARRARPEGGQRGHPGRPDRRRHVGAAADPGARPGRPFLRRGSAGRRRCKGVFLNACTIALDARENTLDAAGSLLEIWRAESINENERRGAFNYDPLGVLAKTGTLYYPAGPLLRDRRQARRRCRTMSHVTALLADGRPYHEAGASEAQELGAMLATLVAYLRACETAGLRPRMALDQIAHRAGRRRRPVPDHGQAARRAPSASPASRTPAAPAARRRRVHFAASTSERMMARRDPWVNMLRTTVACAGAAFGGAEAITRAALHLGARQARRVRPPHRPQHPSGAAGGKRAGARHRPRARLLVSSRR